MSAIIFFSQMVFSPAVMNMISTYAYFSNAYPVDHDINLLIVADVVATAFGIWNLDFFWLVYKLALLPSSKFINAITQSMQALYLDMQ